MTARQAVIFDVDGPLLHLGPAEEAAFFAPFRTLFGIENLSNDWNSYAIRNDREIVHQVLGEHLGDGFGPHHYEEFLAAYDLELTGGIEDGRITVSAVDGADVLLDALSARQPGLVLGMATANLRRAAEVRLVKAGLWHHVSGHPGAADEGGHKHEILARVIAGLGIGAHSIVYIGDNLNDLEVAQVNGTHFIGFHVTQAKRDTLAGNGARHVTGNHGETLALISEMLNITA